MFRIIEKKALAPKTKQLVVEAPLIAQKVLAGQFIILRASQKGERIPLTVAHTDTAKGTITIIFQEIGKTTLLLGSFNTGEHIPDIVGPLGRPTHIEKYGTIVAIGGGVGVAELLPVATAYKQGGNVVFGIIGARTKDLLILENELRNVCDKLYVTTDDGSYGHKGFVSQVLQKLIDNGEKIDLTYAIGPVPMMKVVSHVTQPHHIKTLVSLNPIMVDGTGMCGACRVTVNNKTQFACVDGPEFDAHHVNWQELTQRLTLFREKEKISLDTYTAECACQKNKK